MRKVSAMSGRKNQIRLTKCMKNRLPFPFSQQQKKKFQSLHGCEQIEFDMIL